MRISDWSSDVCSSDLHQVVLKQVIETGLPMVYANKVGGQDELVFDGASFAFNADRTLAFQMNQFEKAITVTDWKKEGDGWRRSEERSVGTECVSTCRSTWSPKNTKHKKNEQKK